MLKAVILDMDGVIVDSEPIREEVHRLLGKEFGYRLKKEDWDTIRGKTAEANIKYLIRKYAPNVSYEYFTKRKDEIFDSMLHKIKAFSGFERFMNRIKGHKVTVATSSTRKNAEAVLKLCKIRHHFEIIVTGCDVRNSKPHPEAFLKAAKKLKVDPKECVVVEDSINGVKAAKAAGMKVIAVTTSHKKKELMEADLITRDIGSITKSMLGSLGGEA
ncbi:MAG: HAD family phosphatase [Candidatus Woesearchaeota archaeon]